MSKEYSIKTHDVFNFSTGWLDDNVGLLFYEVFKRLPSVRAIKYKVNESYIEQIKQLYQHNEAYDLFDYIESDNYDEEEEELEKDNEQDDEEEKGGKKKKEQYQCYIICKKNLIVCQADEYISIAYSDIDYTEIESLLQLGENHKKAKKELNNLLIVTYDHNYFSLKKSKINQTSIKIDTHYNNDFKPVSESIESFLAADNKSGLVILHGKQGTGKTTYIRYLIHQGKKKMLYMGGDLVEKLSDPSFISFVRKQKNSIFIVEDCEELLVSRNGSNRMNAGLINILNISDGLLSDELGIKFICTFNAPLKDIDEALLRKGRLAARYEFQELAAEKVNRIIEEETLKIPKQHHSMTLAELYNYEIQDFSVEKKRVGF